MKRLLLLVPATILTFGLSLIAAEAATINITIDSTGAALNGSGMISKDQLGELLGVANNDASTNLALVNAMLGRWNPLYNPDLPAAGALVLDQAPLTGGTYVGPAGYQYVVFHFGTGQAKDGPWWSAWYLGGEPISFSALPQVGGKNVGGFSSARYFGTVTVPDGGATLMLLGGALVGLGALRRKFGA